MLHVAWWCVFHQNDWKHHAFGCSKQLYRYWHRKNQYSNQITVVWRMYKIAWNCFTIFVQSQLIKCHVEFASHFDINLNSLIFFWFCFSKCCSVGNYLIMVYFLLSKSSFASNFTRWNWVSWKRKRKTGCQHKRPMRRENIYTRYISAGWWTRWSEQKWERER